MSFARINAAFTLVELVVVVLILGVLAAVAAPRLLRSKDEAALNAAVRQLKSIQDAAEMYHAETGNWPANQNSGVCPPSLVDRIPARVFGRTPIGGRYDWDHNTLGIVAAVKIIDADPPTDLWLEIDRRFDDGNTSTGDIQILGGGRHFMFILEH